MHANSAVGHLESGGARALGHLSQPRGWKPHVPSLGFCHIVYAANLRTKILDFRGFDSSILFIIRGGMLMSIGSFPDI